MTSYLPLAVVEVAQVSCCDKSHDRASAAARVYFGMIYGLLSPGFTSMDASSATGWWQGWRECTTFTLIILGTVHVWLCLCGRVCMHD